MTYEEYVHRLSGSKMTDKALKELNDVIAWMQIDLPEEV